MSIVIVTPSGEASFLFPAANQRLSIQSIDAWIVSLRVSLPLPPAAAQTSIHLS